MACGARSRVGSILAVELAWSLQYLESSPLFFSFRSFPHPSVASAPWLHPHHPRRPFVDFSDVPKSADSLARSHLELPNRRQVKIEARHERTNLEEGSGISTKRGLSATVQWRVKLLAIWCEVYV